MKRSDLKDSEYREYFGRYINLVPDIGVAEGLELGKSGFVVFAQSILEEKFDYRYEEGKWTIKEVFQHVIDTERVFSNRAFHIARRDKAPIPGMSQDEYADASGANRKNKDALLEEYEAVRNSTLILFKTFTDEALLEKGTVDGSTMSPRAAGYIIAGHEIYHRKIIEERYL